MDNKHVRWMKVVLMVSSLASILTLGGVAYHDNFAGAWRDAQRRYRDLLAAKAADPNARSVAAGFEVEHKQIYLEDLGRIDRCTTCHLGVENPAMRDAPAPLATHPGELLASHPVDRFGCTVCHQGQGRAVEKNAAHGWLDTRTPVAHHESPLLRREAIYTSCGRCHDELDLFGGFEDLYASRGRSRHPIDAASLATGLPGAGEIEAGKALVVSSGCLGCHKYRGRGGVLGPDITRVGEKTAHDFDFKGVKGEHTVEEWLYEHFRSPAEISPGTTMPDMGLGPKEARRLALYMMSLHRKTAPASHRPPPALAHGERRPVRGETLYAMFCSACHGPDGQGSTMRGGLWPLDADPWGHDWDARNVVVERRAGVEILVPSLNHPDTLAVTSDDYLRRVIETGRPGTKMPGWAGEGGLSPDEITLLVAHLRSWSPRGPEPSEVAERPGDARIGGALYRSNCATCHGETGQGGIGVSLNSPTFLAVASDAFLRETIVQGRPNTAMPAWRAFRAQEVSDLIAFIRSLQAARSSPEGVLAAISDGKASPAIGATLFRSNCEMCHGERGEGDLAPSLNTQEFLGAVPDRYLAATMVRGRPGTAMPAWRHLSNDDLASIVLHLRSWQRVPSKDDAWRAEPVERGDAAAGKTLFGLLCSGCHGPIAEGATGPQLANTEFLREATDRMLLEWISRGKSGTEMRPFRIGGQGIAELDPRHLSDLVAFLRSLEGVRGVDLVAKSPHGRPEKGAVWYADSCAGCHGPNGEGASGPAIANPEFLRVASDGFLLATLALGRSGSEMRPVKKGALSILELSSDQVNDLVAFLRSREYAPPSPRQIPHRFVNPWDLSRGKDLYASNCMGCHGDGQGASWAPRLHNEGFLAAATDGFLQATIVRGRKGTAMRSFGRGGHGVGELSADEIDDIVAYLRSWSRLTPAPRGWNESGRPEDGSVKNGEKDRKVASASEARKETER